MLTLILGRGKSGKTTKLMELVRDCPAQGMAQRIVIVPEQLSHQMERTLGACCGDQISFTSEVLSFTRLCSRVSSLYGGGARQVLDQGGRILTARLALASIHAQLKVFAAASLRPEFLQSIVSMIDELKTYSVTSRQLLDASEEANGFFAQKLRELGLILGAYEGVMAQGACDPRDKLTLLQNQLLTTDYAKNRSFFVDGFTDFSAQELGVLDALLRRGDRVVVTVPFDPVNPEDPLFAPGQETMSRLLHLASSAGQKTEMISATYHRQLPLALTYLEQNLFSYQAPACDEPSEDVVLCAAQDRISECRQCAGELRRLAMEGMRWRDMAVAAGGMEHYGSLLEAVCQSMDIPLFTGQKKPVTAHPAVAFVLLALEAVTENLDLETMTAYLHTAYCGISEDAADALENYAYTWSIRGRKWQTAWTEHPDGYDGRFTEETQETLRHLNEDRARAVEPLWKLSSRLKAAGNTRGQIQALYAFLEETALYTKLQAQLEQMTDLELAQETAQIWNILMECLQQVVSVLGETAQNTGELLKVLRLSLGQYEVGTIPAALDAVQFGTVDSIRGLEPKVVYILGCNEGVLPAGSEGGSLLTERERNILLHEMNIALAPDSEGALQRQLLQIYSAMTAPTQKLYLSYTRSSGGETMQPSFLLGRVQALLPFLTIQTEQSPVENAATADALAQLYFDAIEAPSPGLQGTIGQAAGQVPDLARSIDLARQAAEPRSLLVPDARRLFGAPVVLTASRLDELSNCPLSFFLNYGLKAKVRRESTFDAAEFGTFLHYILEQTLTSIARSGHDYPISEQESHTLVSENMAPYLETRMQNPETLTNRERFLYQRNSQEAELLLTEISQELSQSDFRPCAFELKFGLDRSLGPLTVQGQLGLGRLDGTVDRADLWRSESADYLRIVDYKSGSKRFDYTDLYGGVGMQLFLYLFALEQAGIPGVSDHPVPAGAMYFPAKRNYVSSKGPIDPETAEKMRKNQGIRRTGLILAEEPVMEAMEHGGTGRYLPIKRTRSGAGDCAITREQMEILRAFISRRMAGAVDQIYAGDFAPKPFYRGAAHDPCQWCDYGDICQKDPGFRRQHYHPTITAKEFWDKLGGDDHG